MKRNTLKTAVFIFAIALFMSNESFGQSDDRKERKNPPSSEEIIKQMDKDEDGKLSLEEVKGPLKEDFSKIDTNEDGFLSKEELDEAPKPERKERRRP